MSEAKKALRLAKNSRLKVRRVFGKFSVIRPGAGGAAAGGRRRARNSSDSEAAAMYETFHGREAQFIEEIDVSNNQRVHMAELGRLRHLDVLLEDGSGVKLTFRGVMVCCSPNGGQLYIIRGDQKLDLKFLDLADTLPKDQVDIGRVVRIDYETQKGFHDFADVDYWHKFGELDGRFPSLHFDLLNQSCYISGGGYQVKAEGIIN